MTETDYRFKPASDEPEGTPAEEQVDAKTDAPPKPKPGDADYDWSQHYDTETIFVHTFPDGKVVALKPFAAMYSKTWLYKLRNVKTNEAVIFATIDRGACPEARQVLENLDDADGDPIDELWNAWRDAGTSHSGDADGEGLTTGN